MRVMRLRQVYRLQRLRRPLAGQLRLRLGAEDLRMRSWALAQRRELRASAPSLALVPFKLADIGEGIAEVEVLEWYVQPGDAVKQFDRICEVQSDKATVEITSRFDGVIESVEWKVGDMATVGSTLVQIQVEGQDAGLADPAADPEPAAAAAEPEAAAAALEEEAAAAAAAAAAAVHQPPRSLLREGSFSVDPVLRPAKSVIGEADASTPRSSARVAAADSEVGAGSRVLATPAVRRLAKDHQLDLLAVPATGPGGRVLKGDVLAFVASVPLQERQRLAASASASASALASASASLAPSEATEPSASSVFATRLTKDVVVPVAGLQRIMVKSMEASLRIPHFSLMEEVCLDQLAAVRAEVRPSAASAGVPRLSYMPFAIKAASLALLQFPGLNAHIKDDASEVVHRASHNIGVAMDTPRGLLVPVVQDVQSKSVLEVAAELLRLQALGAANKLSEAELSGGTFTLSNIGAIGGTYASPLIPAPTVVIGAMGKLRTLPRFADDGVTVVPAKLMHVSWAADHRAVDGATMTRFSNAFKGFLEHPSTMILSLS